MVQDPTMPSGTMVDVHGVVVTAIDLFGTKKGDIWVEEPAGGKRSGVHVFGPNANDVALLNVGDIVDITGAEKFEFPAGAVDDYHSLTELEQPKGGMMKITKTGTGTVPAPQMLDASMIDAMTADARGMYMEDWEGVRIEFTNVLATGPVAPFGAGAVDQQEFPIVSGLKVESILTALPDSVSATSCFASIVGVEDYVASTLVIYPTDAADIGTGNGTGCAAPQFIPATVADLQDGTRKVNDKVKLTGVYIMGTETVAAGFGPRVWISDTLNAAAGKGVLIFQSGAVNATTAPLGTQVDVTATLTEFLPKGATGKTETELEPATVTLNTAATTAPTPLAIDAATIPTIFDITNGEQYEGTLVTIKGVKVTAQGSGADTTHNMITLTDAAGDTITMDDDAFDFYGGAMATPNLPAVGTCYSTLTGLMDVQGNDNVRTINPHAATDMVVDAAGTSCN
jgi:hypothetical protein